MKRDAKKELRKLLRAPKAGAPPLNPAESRRSKRAAITTEDAKRNLARAMEVLETQLESADADVARRAATAMSSLVQRNQAHEEPDPDEHAEFIAIIAREGVADHWASTAAAVAGCILPDGVLVDGPLPRPTVDQAEIIGRYLEAIIGKESGAPEVSADAPQQGGGAEVESTALGGAPVPETEPPPPTKPDRDSELCRCGCTRKRHESRALECADCPCPLWQKPEAALPVVDDPDDPYHMRHAPRASNFAFVGRR